MAFDPSIVKCGYKWANRKLGGDHEIALENAPRFRPSLTLPVSRSPVEDNRIPSAVPEPSKTVPLFRLPPASTTSTGDDDFVPPAMIDSGTAITASVYLSKR